MPIEKPPGLRDSARSVSPTSSSSESISPAALLSPIASAWIFMLRLAVARE